MKRILVWLLVCSTCVGLYAFIQKQEEHQLNLIKELTGFNDSRVVWSDSTAEGYSKNFTYWNNDHCLDVIIIKDGKAEYTGDYFCSDSKLTKD